MKFVPWTMAAFLSPSPETRSSGSSSTSRQNLFPVPHADMAIVTPAGISTHDTLYRSTSTTNALTANIREWLVPSALAIPSEQDVELLQQAMAAFYGKDMFGKNRDVAKAEELLSKALVAWKDQPADERAGLYRVRGDCYMALLKPQQAIADYTNAIALLLESLPDADLADPAELPAARLGRARAIRSLKNDAPDKQKQMAAQDYQLALRLTSREDWDTDKEKEEDGASRNPYAAWEWGQALRATGDYKRASQAHALASFAFEEIGDKARSVISAIDTGIDLAAASDPEAKTVLDKAIKRTTQVEGRDVDLLQRVIAKEGEGRVALASILWNSGDRAGAEQQLGTSCVRLDQLEADAMERAAKKSAAGAAPAAEKLKFSIDDTAGPFETSCSRFKNEKFLSDTLEWPASLQEKVKKLETLK